MFAFLSMMGKFELNGELFKLLQTKLETISKFSLIILTGLSLYRQTICATYLKLCPW